MSIIDKFGDDYLWTRVLHNLGMRIPPSLGKGRKKSISFERIPLAKIILSKEILILTFLSVLLSLFKHGMTGKKGQISIFFVNSLTTMLNRHLVRIQLPDRKGENCGHGQEIFCQYLQERHLGRSEGSLGPWSSRK